MLFTNSALVHTDFTDPIKSYGVSYLLVMAIGAVYQSIHFFRLWEKTVREKESLERAHLSSQLEGLRNQVNPHFLFNSLNTLNYLIPEDSEKAVRFVQQLSKVYRYVLESRDDKLIPISQELQFLDAYIFLQKERFGEKLQISMQGLEDNQSYAIVPLTLQMLFENAIKHNIISTESPLVVELFIEGESLIVRNNLQRKNQVMDSTGVGLQNIKERYRMLLDKTVDVIVSDRYYTVVLPLIKLSNESV
jgi:LytS/YehU family sensor histidine kinase